MKPGIEMLWQADGRERCGGMCRRIPIDVEETEVHVGAVNAAKLVQFGRRWVVDGLPIVNASSHFVCMVTAGCKSDQQAAAKRRYNSYGFVCRPIKEQSLFARPVSI